MNLAQWLHQFNARNSGQFENSSAPNNTELDVGRSHVGGGLMYATVRLRKLGNSALRLCSLKVHEYGGNSFQNGCPSMTSLDNLN